MVTVVLNGRAVIEQTLRSVFDQKDSDVEYVVIDGGSTDGTLDILREHESRLDYLVSEPDRGIADGFNKGVAAARGEVIGILNAGDWYAPGALNAVGAARDAGNRFAIYHGDMSYHQEDGTHALDVRPRPDDIWKYMSMYHPTMFVEGDVYQRLGTFSARFPVSMDCEFVHRCVQAGVRFVYIPRIQAHMRLGGNSGRKYRRAFAEFRDSAILHGAPRFSTWARYYARTVKRTLLRYRWGRALKRFRDRVFPESRP